MAIFLVERTLPGMTVRDLKAAARALDESCRRTSTSRVRHLRTVLTVGGSRCLSLFEGESKDVVTQVLSVAQFTFTAIEEVEQIVSAADGESPPRNPADHMSARGSA